MTVYFIGAGPGDPELITVKGQRLIRSCPVIIYAGSLVPAAVLDAEVDRWVADILSSAPLSLKAIKAIVRETGELSVHDAYTHETPELIAALNSEDADEGVRAFREKRAPVWRGR